MSTDATQKQNSGETKVVGSDSTGLETNWVKATSTGDLGTVDTCDTAGVSGAISVTTTPIELKVGASRLTSRKYATAIPTDGVVYWGYTNTVTSTTGTPIFKNQFEPFPLGPNLAVYLVSASGTVNVRVTEAS